MISPTDSGRFRLPTYGRIRAAKGCSSTDRTAGKEYNEAGIAARNSYQRVGFRKMQQIRLLLGDESAIESDLPLVIVF